MPEKAIPPDLLQETIEKEFACQRCGNCCKGDGAVAIEAPEVKRMADYLGLTVRDFHRSYTVKVADGHWWLRDKINDERWCIFLERDDSGLYYCRVNPAKPDQCASFPYKWRNPESTRNCAGLKRLIKDLRTRLADPGDGGAAR